VYTQGRGVQVASGLSGTPDFTIEVWVQLISNTVAQTFFEIGNSASSGGTIAMGVDTSGKLTLTINRADPGSTFVHTPGSVSLPIGTWFHVGCVLQTKWDANTYQVCSLYNGACTLGLSYAKSIFSSGMGSICQAGGNLGSTSYLTGSITNFRVSSSPTVYQNPWGTRLSYTKVYPLEKLDSTTVLLQGSPIVNMASPLSIVTALSLFPIVMMPTLLNNVPVSLAGAYNLSVGYIGPRSLALSAATSFTMECWTYFQTGFSTVVLDNIPPGTSNTTGRIVLYILNSTGQLMYNFNPQSQNLSLGSNVVAAPSVWNHIAYVWNATTNVITGYINGVAGDTPRTITGFTAIGSTITIGIDCTSPTQFPGSMQVMQPLLRNRVVYTGNFTPSNDLTPIWSDTSVLYFLGSNLVDLVSGSVVPTGGIVVSTYRALV
jgi:hypothetical protein